jgi:hypothetical protein
VKKSGSGERERHSSQHQGHAYAFMVTAGHESDEAGEQHHEAARDCERDHSPSAAHTEKRLNVAVPFQGRSSRANTGMTKPAIHTEPRDGQGWVNIREGSSRALDKFTTKAEAQAAGRERARRDKVEHIVHTKDGRIAMRNSYGNDPTRSPG